MDKSDKQRILLANERWPGRESNTRHADFQGVTAESCNTLTQKDVANPAALRITVPPALEALSKAFDSFWLATPNHAADAP